MILNKIDTHLISNEIADTQLIFFINLTLFILKYSILITNTIKTLKLRNIYRIFKTKDY